MQRLPQSVENRAKVRLRWPKQLPTALTDRHHLMVQAGTGTGKSVAYLVPALVHGRKVLVATATLALQRQLKTNVIYLQWFPALEKVFRSRDYLWNL
jgi:Rad3-related DNA helicase